MSQNDGKRVSYVLKISQQSLKSTNLFLELEPAHCNFLISAILIGENNSIDTVNNTARNLEFTSVYGFSVKVSNGYVSGHLQGIYYNID